MVLLPPEVSKLVQWGIIFKKDDCPTVCSTSLALENFVASYTDRTKLTIVEYFKRAYLGLP